jgi:hypothetical protein
MADFELRRQQWQSTRAWLGRLAPSLSLTHDGLCGGPKQLYELVLRWRSPGECYTYDLSMYLFLLPCCYCCSTYGLRLYVSLVETFLFTI